MESPLISIIIPVYNADRFLKRTIDSVLSQTYINWELILVDDGATDSSGCICDEYASQDRRIAVCHQVNGGVSKARNTGINKCRGEWCCFVDSDDWLEPDYLANYLVPNYNKYGCIIQSFCIDNEINGKSKCCVLHEHIIQNASELEHFLEYTDVVHNGFLWHRLFRVQTIRENNILFPEGISFAEDGIFFLNYIQYSELFYITNKIGYHYIIRKGSLTSKGQKLDRKLCYRLIEGIIIPTDKIVKKCHPNLEIVDGLKKYNWNLIIAWLFERSMNNKDDYYSNVNFLHTIQGSSFIDTNIESGSCLFKLIVKTVCLKPSSTNYRRLNILLCLNRNVQKLNNIFKGIKQRLKGLI